MQAEHHPAGGDGSDGSGGGGGRGVGSHVVGNVFFFCNCMGTSLYILLTKVRAHGPPRASGHRCCPPRCRA